MDLVRVLQEEARHVYAVTERLFLRAEGEPLDWKPETGPNWMTLGQLLEHCRAHVRLRVLQQLDQGLRGARAAHLLKPAQGDLARLGREFLAIPGPTTMPDEVLQAMHRPALDIYSREMI